MDSGVLTKADDNYECKKKEHFFTTTRIIIGRRNCVLLQSQWMTSWTTCELATLTNEPLTTRNDLKNMWTTPADRQSDFIEPSATYNEDNRQHAYTTRRRWISNELTAREKPRRMQRASWISAIYTVEEMSRTWSPPSCCWIIKGE